MSPRAAEIQAQHARRFRVLDELGRGGFGTVLKAEMSGAGGFRKIVALKVLSTEVTASAEASRRLRDEARMLGLLRHPALVQVDGLVQLGESWAVVMEYVEGVDLRRLLEAGPVPVRAALEIVAEVALALDAAYNALSPEGAPLRLIHRDVKPANIRLTPGGVVKLLDFGIARAEFEAREADSRSGLIGTLAYMSPERMEGEDGPAGDVYALGVVLYELISGEMFGRSSGNVERHRARVEEVVTTARRALPGHGARVAGILEATLRYEAGERPTAAELAHRCEALADAVGGEKLRRWAASALSRPRASAPRPGSKLVGAVAVEVEAESFSWQGGAGGRGGTQTRDGTQATPRPWVVVAGGAAVLLGLLSSAAAGLVLWKLWPGEEPAELPASTRAEEPEVATQPAPPSEPAQAPEPAAQAAPQPTPTSSTSASEPASSARKPPTTSAPDTGAVLVTGAQATVELVPVGGGASARPGDAVPVGSYKLRWTFAGQGTMTAHQEIRVEKGKTVTIRCLADGFYFCDPVL